MDPNTGKVIEVHVYSSLLFAPFIYIGLIAKLNFNISIKYIKYIKYVKYIKYINCGKDLHTICRYPNDNTIFNFDADSSFNFLNRPRLRGIKQKKAIIHPSSSMRFRLGFFSIS